MHTQGTSEQGLNAELTKLGIEGIEKELEVIVGTVAKRLAGRLERPVSRDELVGWARIGVTRAIALFKGDRIDAKDRRVRVIDYLIRKGYWQAYDQMRSAKVIGRVRNGKHYGGQVMTTQFSQLNDVLPNRDVGLGKGDVADESALSDPADKAALRDLIDTVVSKLTGTEQEIFELHYRQDMALRDIATGKGVTYARIYQVHTKVLGKVRDYLTGNETHFSGR